MPFQAGPSQVTSDLSKLKGSHTLAFLIKVDRPQFISLFVLVLVGIWVVSRLVIMNKAMALSSVDVRPHPPQMSAQAWLRAQGACLTLGEAATYSPQGLHRLTPPRNSGDHLMLIQVCGLQLIFKKFYYLLFVNTPVGINMPLLI